MLAWLAENAVIALLLALGVALLCRVLRPRPAVEHALWLVVLVKLLTPPAIVWPWAGTLGELARGGGGETRVPTPERPDATESPFESARPAPVAQPAETPEPAPSARDGGLASAVTSRPLAGGGDLSDAAGGTIASLEAPAVMAGGTSSTAAPRLAEVPGPAGELQLQPGPEAAASRFYVGGAERPSPRPPIGPLQIATLVWLAGVLTMLAVEVARNVRLRRLVAKGQAPPPPIAQHVTKLAARLRVRPSRVVMVPGIGSPLVWSVGPPKLLLPLRLFGRLDATQWQSAIAHELLHLRRRDHWLAWIELLAACVWWWYPLVWGVRRRLEESREAACDAWVVGVLPEARRAYAEALIEVARIGARAAPAPAISMGRGDRKAFQRRLTMIMRERVPFRMSRWGLGAAVVLAVAAVPGWLRGQEERLERDRPAALERDEGERDPDRQGEVERAGDRAREGDPANRGERDRQLEGDREGEGDRRRQPEREADRRREGDAFRHAARADREAVIHHLRQAADHLAAAGHPDEARRLLEQAEALSRDLQIPAGEEGLHDREQGRAHEGIEAGARRDPAHAETFRAEEREAQLRLAEQRLRELQLMLQAERVAAENLAAEQDRLRELAARRVVSEIEVQAAEVERLRAQGRIAQLEREMTEAQLARERIEGQTRETPESVEDAIRRLHTQAERLAAAGRVQEARELAEQAERLAAEHQARQAQFDAARTQHETAERERRDQEREQRAYEREHRDQDRDARDARRETDLAAAVHALRAEVEQLRAELAELRETVERGGQQPTEP